MITLITGTPGAGKTLYSLRFLKEILGTYRFVYAHGITGLTLEHEIIICESHSCDFCRSLKNQETYKKVKDWNTFADDGSVLFLDECQNIYRSKGTVSVADFEVHRHKGLDFFIVTQHPMLINSDLRKLVGRHIHLIADFTGRWQYEWSECSQNISKTTAIKSRYKLDKGLFALYQSSSLHTKVQRKIPFSVYLFFISLVFVIFLCYPLFVKYSKPKPIDALPTTPQAVKSVSSQKNEIVTKSNQPNSQISSSQVSVFSDSDIELLPESSRWRLVDYRKFVDVGDSYEVQPDLTATTYYIEDGQRNRRAISSRRCKVIDNDVLCVIGGKLVASWTGQQQSQSSSVIASDTLSTQAMSFLK